MKIDNISITIDPDRFPHNAAFSRCNISVDMITDNCKWPSNDLLPSIHLHCQQKILNLKAQNAIGSQRRRIHYPSDIVVGLLRCIRSLGITHLGHGHAPMFRRVPSRILGFRFIQSVNSQECENGILFRIISCISKNSQVETTSNSIATLNNDAMFISFQEFIIQKNFPLSV